MPRRTGDSSQQIKDLELKIRKLQDKVDGLLGDVAKLTVTKAPVIQPTVIGDVLRELFRSESWVKDLVKRSIVETSRPQVEAQVASMAHSLEERVQGQVTDYTNANLPKISEHVARLVMRQIASGIYPSGDGNGVPTGVPPWFVVVSDPTQFFKNAGINIPTVSGVAPKKQA